MKIDSINSHNDLDYKTITRIHCKNKYIVTYINESSYYIDELIILNWTLNWTLINDHSLDQK